MLQPLFTDKGNFSKKAYKDFFNYQAKNFTSNNFKIKKLDYVRSSKTLFVDIEKSLTITGDNKNICSVNFPIGIKGGILTQHINLAKNTFKITYTIKLDDLNREQLLIEFFNRTELNK